MQHPDSDDLALLALGESLGSAVDSHVAGCAHCTAEIAAFRTTVGLAELSNYGEAAPQPGEHVWRAIAAELGFDTARTVGSVATSVDDPDQADSAAAGRADLGPDRGRRPGLNGSKGPWLRAVPGSNAGRPDDAASREAPGSPREAPVGDSSERETDFTAGGPEGDSGHSTAADFSARGEVTDTSEPGTVTDLSGRRSVAADPTRGASTRRWRWAAPLAAVVVGIAVGAGAVVISQNRSTEVTVEAVAPLTPVPGGPLTADEQQQLGKAELVAASAGQQVKVDAPDLPPSANDYEVWLFGGEGRMVALGTLAGGTGTFTVPPGISTSEYRVVDVSDEPPDGNPAHSGISLVRGTFS